MSEQVIGEELSAGFWSTVERAGGDRQKFRSLLWEMSEEEICRFHREYKLAASVLTGEPFDKIIYEDSGESEDGIDDIAEWVVVQGRAFYEAILQTPEDIPRHVDGGDPALIVHVIYEVFQKKFSKDLAGEDSAWP